MENNRHNEGDYLAAAVLNAASDWFKANTSQLSDAVVRLERAVRAREAYYEKLNNPVQHDPNTTF